MILNISTDRLAVSTVDKDIIIGARSHKFVSLAGQIGHSVGNGTPSLRRGYRHRYRCARSWLVSLVGPIGHSDVNGSSPLRRFLGVVLPSR